MTGFCKKIIRGLHNLRPEPGGCVATIGSFDGVHLGHQIILKQVIAKAKALHLPATVVLFEPQPSEYLYGRQAPARLMRFREKAAALFDIGIDRIVCLYFNESLRLLSATDFIDNIVIKGLQPKYMVIGDDFHFGRDREGEVALLREAGISNGFEVADTDTFTVDDERVSSTRVRELLAAGSFKVAAQLLGKPYTMCGRVTYGRQLGRQIGVPTANLLLHRYRSPLNGVFAVVAHLNDGLSSEGRQGVANIGFRPTVNGDSRPVLEVHLFDFNRTLYGQVIQVAFEKKLREEQAFDSLVQLKQQIDKDIDVAKRFFSRRI